MTKQTQQLIMMLAVGILIGIITVYVFSADSSHDTKNDSTTPSSVADLAFTPIATSTEVIGHGTKVTLPPQIPSNSRIGLNVADQIHDTIVHVTGLNVQEISWVAVYDDLEGKPSVILGAQKVRPGEMATTVELLRREGTVAGMTYYVAILPDNGDGVFNRLSDLPPFSPDKMVIVKFLAQ